MLVQISPNFIEVSYKCLQFLNLNLPLAGRSTKIPWGDLRSRLYLCVSFDVLHRPPMTVRLNRK